MHLNHTDNNIEGSDIKPRRTKVKWVMLVMLCCVIVGFAAGELTGWYFLRHPTEKLISEKLQRTVVLQAPFKLQLFGSIHLSLGGMRISAPSQFGVAYLLDSHDIQLTMRYTDLLHISPKQPMRVKLLRVDSLDAKLIRLMDGQATWQFHPEDTASRPPPIINTFVVKHGTARFEDHITKSALDMTASTQEEAGEHGLTSSLDVGGQFRGKPLKGHIDTNGFLPIAAQDASSEPIETKLWLEYAKIRLDFTGAANDIFGTQDVQGEFNIKGASLGILGDLLNTPLPTTDPFQLNGDVYKEDALWVIHVAKASIAHTRLMAYLRYDPRPAKPLLTGTLSGSQFMLADLAPAFGTKTEDGDPAKKRAGYVIPDRPIDLPSLNKMNMQIKVDLAYLDLGNAFNHPISPFKADLSVEEGKLTLQNIDATTADGHVSGLMSVDAHREQMADARTPASAVLPQWKIDLNWKNINLEKWLTISEERKQAAKKKGEKTVPPAYVTGQLSGKTTLSGQGNSTAKLLGSLDGKVVMVIQHGSVSHLVIEMLGLDIAQSLGLLIKGDEPEPLQCAIMDWHAKNGVFSPNVAIADTPVTRVLINGDFNLATEHLNLTLVAKPKNISPFTTRSPIEVTGTLDQPKVAPKGGPIAARVAGGLALAIINPLTAILPFIDLGEAIKEAPCQTMYADFKNKAH